MYIDVGGSGPDLVLIHGWAMHGGIFAPLRAALEPHFRLHVVDLPGHGRSRDAAIEQLEPAACAAAIVAATPPATWIGWSLGGLIASQAALDHPSHVQGLVAIASSPRFVAAADWPAGIPASTFAEFANGLAGDFRSTVERFLALETLGSPNAQADLRDLKKIAFAHGEPSLDALQAGLDLLERTDLRARVGTLAQPSLWLSGRRDRLVAPAAMQWAADQAQRSAFASINAGHAPFLSHPGEVAAEIRAFAEGLA